MKKISIIIALYGFVFAQSSFITQKEYAALLYKNPRGIGCHKCHGLRGEGKIIAKYFITKKVKEADEIFKVKIPKQFVAPAINNISYKQFYKALTMPILGMPRYYLTEKEIKTLYFYLQEVKMDKYHD